MHTNIIPHDFWLVETEHTKLLDICEYKDLLHIELFNFILWKNEGEYAIITKAQIKEALRVFKELNSAPEDHLSTAGFPCIFWDDCVPVGPMRAEVMLGKEHEFYREAEKPEDGSDGGT